MSASGLIVQKETIVKRCVARTGLIFNTVKFLSVVEIS